MRFGILGSLLVEADDGARISVAAARQRVLLAALLARANRIVAVDELAELVWDGVPPAGAARTVRVYAMRLRRQIGPGPAERLVTRDPGYLCQVAPGELDVLRFEQLCREGGAALRAGAWEQASGRLAEALALWRGAPLADVPSQSLRAECVPRWEQLRAQAVDWRVEADLNLGRHEELVPELEGLVHEHPLREHGHGQLMLALYRSGRPAEALAAYQRARRTLIDELGVEPGPELRDLHRGILDADPALAAPPRRPLPQATDAAEGASAAAADPGSVKADGARESGLGGVVPRQLPPAIAHFTGRAEALRTLTRLAGRGPVAPGAQAPGPDDAPQLTGAARGPTEAKDAAQDADRAARHPGSAQQPAEPAEPGAAPSGAVPISVIDGTAGVGKTALAVHWAHRAAAYFPDGQLYVNLRGFDRSAQPVAPSTAIRGFLDALGVPSERIPAGLEEQVGLYRSVLAGKRALVILDNARDAEQVRPLLPGGPGCLVLVTSRNQLIGLVAVEGAQSLTLHLLEPAEARELLTRRLGAARTQAEPAAVEELAERCARLPLALNIVAARGTLRPDLSLAELVRELSDAKDPLSGLDTVDVAASVRHVFWWSYRTLEPAAARMFRLLGLLPGPDLSAAAAASLAGTDDGDARTALDELTRANLATEHRPGRYMLHDLLRAYAADQCRAHEDEAARRAALHRVLDHYLHTAHAAALLLHPARDVLDLEPPQPGAVPEQPADDAAARAWLEAERPALLAAVTAAADEGFDRHACQLAWSLATYLDRGGYWPELAAVQTTALAAAERLGDLSAQAHTHRTFGGAHILRGLYTEADHHLQAALELYRRLGDPVGEAHTHISLSWLYEQQDLAAQALTHVEQALARYEAAGHRAGRAGALNAAGWLHSLLGRPQEALRCCTLALELHRQLGNKDGEADTLDSLGHTHQQLGEYREALDCYERALALVEQLGGRHQQAATLTRLGEVHRALGERAAAREAWTRAIELFEALGHPRAAQLRGERDALD